VTRPRLDDWFRDGAATRKARPDDPLRVISGERSGEPILPVTGDLQMSCEVKPRLTLVRTAATMAVQALGALPFM
jgi:hypothetical protein